ncbi:DUF116 domain-containing protein [archaeon]|nr:DUF116 domain-containing protein [archaeon]
MEILFLLGLITLALLIGLATLVIVGLVLVLIFIKTSRIIVPRVTLLVVSMMEIPIKHILWTFKINTKHEGQDRIDLMLAKIRNQVYTKHFSEIPMSQRAIFLPQCIRHAECPAKLTGEGIICIGCGRCEAAKIKKEAEELGCMFFIVPGSSFVKRMIAKHKPKAIIGLGCYNEIKEGTAMTSALGIPTQGVPLLTDGCVGTTADWDELRKTMRLGT